MDKRERLARQSQLRGATWLVPTVGYLLLLALTSGVGYVKGAEGETLMPKKTVQAVLAEHTDRLMALPGVVGMAEGRCAGKPCIKVYVVDKKPEVLTQIPSIIEGYAVKVEATGEFRALTPSDPS